MELPAELQVKIIKYYFGTFDVTLNRRAFPASDDTIDSHNVKWLLVLKKTLFCFGQHQVSKE